MNKQVLRVLLGLALPMTVGCALVSKSELVVPRYYSPELPLSSAPKRDVSSANALDLSLRLGRVSVGDHLRERIVYRESPEELAYYDERRWAEGPEAYVRRALARALFEEHGIHHVVSGAAPTLEVEVLAFEEVRKPKPLARVALTAVLHDQKTVHLEQTFVGEVPFDPADDNALSRAMAEALRGVVVEVAEQSTKSLRAMATPTVLPPCAEATTSPPP